MKVLIILSALLVQFSFAAKSYEGDQVLKVYAQGENRRVIKDLAASLDQKVWSVQNNYVDIAVVSNMVPIVKKRLEKLGHPYTVMIKNIQTTIDDQQKIREARAPVEPSVDIDTAVYHDLDTINAYLDALAVEFDYITVETVGQSYEGRDVKLLKMAATPGNENVIWIQCGIHAREWVSPATCIYGLDMLTKGYLAGTDADLVNFVESHDIYIVVNVNPDGYVYSWTDDRLWRKNRRPDSGSGCVGVDLNRNYDAGDGSFGGEGASDRPCLETYHGESGFSEPETAIMRDRIELIQQTQTVTTFYCIHSYSQLWLIPYGYTVLPPPNYDAQYAASAAAVDALAAIEGTIYTYGSISTTIYVASGGSVDWATSRNISFAYTPELRDTGEYGFLLPEDQIIPTANELWTGLFAAWDYENQNKGH